MTNWDLAACQWEDPETFWPLTWGPTFEYEIAAAKKICGRCRIKESCLADALANSDDGIRGGTTEPERREMTQAMGEDAPGPRKKCLDCGEKLPLAQFDRRGRSLDRHDNRCKKCRAREHARNKAAREAVNA